MSNYKTISDKKITVINKTNDKNTEPLIRKTPNVSSAVTPINTSVSVSESFTISNIPMPSSTKTLIAVCLMLASGFFLGLCAAIINWGSQLGFSSMEMLMWRSGMQCVIAIISSYAAGMAKTEWKQFISLTQMEKVYLALRGLSGGIGVACYFHAITLINVGDAITILSIYPVIAAFLAYFILKERVTILHFLALVFAVIGLVLIAQPSFIFRNDSGAHNIKGSASLLGYFISLCGGIIGGVVFIFIVKAKNAPTTSLVCSQGIFCFLIAIVLCFSVQSFKKLENWKDGLCFVGLAIGGFLAQWTFNQGAKMIQAGLSSLLRATDTVWSYFWQIVWFHKYPNYITIIGAIGVISGVGLVSFEKIRAKKRKELAGEQFNRNDNLLPIQSKSELIDSYFSKSYSHLH